MYEYFAAIANWGPSKAINESSWIFALVQAFHLVSLGFLAGSLLMVDLRLLGRGFSQQPLATVARDARPWLIGSLVAMVLTGVPQFISLATKEYDSVYFRWKMLMLLIALIFTFTIRRQVAQNGLAIGRPHLAKMTAIVSLALWFGVAWGGRWIGFS